MNPAPSRLRALAHPEDLHSPGGDTTDLTATLLPIDREPAAPSTYVAELSRYREREERRPDLDTDAVDEPNPWGLRGAGSSWSLGRAGGVALLVVVLVCAGFALAKIMRAEPQSVSAPQLPGLAETSIETSAGESGAAAEDTEAAKEPKTDIVVSVVGMVHQPGLVTLGPGTRVADAIAAAGGSREGADTTSLNLARPVADGEQVVVGSVPPEGPPPSASTILAAGADDQSAPSAPNGDNGSAAPAGEGKVNLNSADAAALESLNGVGPATAAAIIDYRESSGPFTSVEQLGEVNGIGPAKLANLREQVVV